MVVDFPVIWTSFALVRHLGYHLSSKYPLHVSQRICLLDIGVDPSFCLTVLSIAGESLSLEVTPWMSCPVAADLIAVLEGSVRFLDDINLPVKDDQSEVLLLLLLVLLPRNLSSPIPRPGNAPVDPMWNLGEVLVWPLLP